jgi:hypothetical protein
MTTMDVPLMKIRHYRQIYTDRPDPIVFLPIAVSTSGRVYEDFTRLFFLHAHREPSTLVGELPEESEQFRFLRASRLTNLKGSVGLILTKASVMRVTIPIDLSTRSFIPLPLFFNSHRVPPLLNQSLVLIPLFPDSLQVDRMSRLVVGVNLGSVLVVMTRDMTRSRIHVYVQGVWYSIVVVFTKVEKIYREYYIRGVLFRDDTETKKYLFCFRDKRFCQKGQRYISQTIHVRRFA